MSVRRIAAVVGVSKSSVSLWVRDVRPRHRVEPERPPVPAPAPTLSGALRRCSRCRETKPVEAFNRMGEGRQFYCRECLREYFRLRGDLHRAQVRATRPQRRDRSRSVVREVLAQAACADCGLSDIVVLEFDHIGPKVATVSRLVAQSAGRRRLLDEISLCEIVCANCHRRRTASRAGSFRSTDRRAPTWTDAQLRNQRYLLDVLEANRCRDCGEGDPVVLDFDHRADKRGNVSSMADWASPRTLRDEIAKCDVRCANCHRRRTQTAVRSYRWRR